MATSSKLMRKSSTLEIVKQKEVSVVEETYHELVDNDQTDGGAGETENGENVEAEDTTQGGPKSQGWNKIAKIINLSAALNEASPPVEEGGTLDLSAEDFRVGIPYRFKVHLEQLEGNTLVVTCDPTEGASIKIATHEKEGIVTYMCTIVPRKDGEFTLSTLFGKKQVLGSPFKVIFNSPADASLCSLKEAPEECRTSVDINTLTFCVRTNQERGGLLTASAKSLSSKANMPVTVLESGQGHYDVEFDSNDGKKYRLTVKFDNQHINGSPFLLYLSDASVCTVAGDGITRGIVGQDNSFDVFTKGAGPGKLRVKVEGKSSALVIIKPKGEDVYEVNYFPKKVGSYQITVLWLEEEIPGSPFVVPCHKPVGVTVPKPEKYNIYLIGESYKFKVDAQELGEGTLDANTIEEGSADLNVTSLGKNQYRVDMIPRAVGIAHISIRWSGTEVPGSPFPVDIQCKPESSQVTTSGPVYEVVSDKLMRKSSTLEIEDQRFNIDFFPVDSSEYLLTIKYDEQHITGSPFKLVLGPPPTDANQVTAQGDGLVSCIIDKWAKFRVNTEHAGEGKLAVRVRGVGEDVNCNISQDPQNEFEYEVAYSAKKEGDYFVTVEWAGQEIPSSPFMVHCYHPSDHSIFSIENAQTETTMGEPLKFMVHSGGIPDSGEMSVTAQSSTNKNTKGEALRQLNGDYLCSVNVAKPGRYVIHVRLNGNHIRGSPFKAKFLMPPKPQNVRAHGPGLEDGYVGQEGNFMVETGDGGAGTLAVRVHGPKGAFKINMRRHPDNDRTILVRYDPTYPGAYKVDITWSEIHVPGSPFTVNIRPQREKRI